MRWEIATAVAGALLAINPFDEPNVQQAKDATNALLDRVQDEGTPAGRGRRRDARTAITLTLSAAARQALAGRGAEALLTLLHPGDYFALLAYLGPDPALAAALQALRARASAIARASRRCSATDRAICTRPGSCTRAVRTPACSC